MEDALRFEDDMKVSEEGKRERVKMEMSWRVVRSCKKGQKGSSNKT